MLFQFFQDSYPIYKLLLSRHETPYQSAQEIINYLKSQIDEHKDARFLGEFDHYSHTRGLEQGEIAEEIIDARNILFCFGLKLTTPEILALRPRSIGVAETPNGFVISYLKAPMAEANETMELWVSGLQKQAA